MFGGGHPLLHVIQSCAGGRSKGEDTTCHRKFSAGRVFPLSAAGGWTGTSRGWTLVGLHSLLADIAREREKIMTSQASMATFAKG